MVPINADRFAGRMVISSKIYSLMLKTDVHYPDTVSEQPDANMGRA